MKNYNLLFIFAVRLIQEEWIADSGGIFKKSFDNIYPEIDTEITEDMQQEEYKDVAGVSLNGYDLVKITSYTDTIDGRATALSSEPSFIFDTSTDTIYIRLEDYADPRTKEIHLAVAIHVSRQSYDDIVNELLYREDLIAIPSLKEEKDPLYYKNMSFDSFTVDINNTGHKYDSLVEKNVIGQVGQYWWGLQNALFSTYKKIKQAKAEKLVYSGNRLAVSFVDERKILSRKIPKNYFTTTDYPDMRNEFVGQPKTLLYGYNFNHICTPLDDNVVQTNYKFMVCDTYYHDIYDFGGGFDPIIFTGGVNVTAFILNWSSATGTFEIPAAYYTPGEKVLFTGYGFVDDTFSLVIANPIKIILDLFENLLDIAYNDTSFNQDEINYEIGLAQQVSLAITEKEEFIDIINRITAGTDIGFFPERDGRYTARSYDATQTPILTIRNEMWTKEPSYSSDKAGIFSSITANYWKNLSTDTWYTYTDDTYEDDFYAEFGFNKEEKFDCIYTTINAVQSFTASIMERAKNKKEIVVGLLKDEYIDLDYVKIGKLAQIEVDRIINPGVFKPWLGKLKCEILSVEPLLESRQVEIVFRIIERIDEFEFIYEYDFNGDETTDIFDFNGGDDTEILDLGGIDS